MLRGLGDLVTKSCNRTIMGLQGGCDSTWVPQHNPSKTGWVGERALSHHCPYPKPVTLTPTPEP